MLEWYRLFETSNAVQASDILLVAGMPPFLKTAGGLRAVAVAPITDVEIGAMLRQLSEWPDWPINREYFTFLCCSKKKWWYRVASFGLPAPHFTILMRMIEPPSGEELTDATWWDNEL